MRSLNEIQLRALYSDYVYYRDCLPVGVRQLTIPDFYKRNAEKYSEMKNG